MTNSTSLTILKLAGILKHLIKLSYDLVLQQKILIDTIGLTYNEGAVLLKNRMEANLGLYFGTIYKQTGGPTDPELIKILRDNDPKKKITYEVHSGPHAFTVTTIRLIHDNSFILYYNHEQSCENRVAFVLNEEAKSSGLTEDILKEFAKNSVRLRDIRVTICIIIRLLNLKNIYCNLETLVLYVTSEFTVQFRTKTTYEIGITQFNMDKLSIYLDSETVMTRRELPIYLDLIKKGLTKFKNYWLWKIFDNIPL